MKCKNENTLAYFFLVIWVIVGAYAIITNQI